MRFTPKKNFEYPFFIGLYWLIFWIIASVILFIYISKNSSGGYVIKHDCVREDKETKLCTLYSRAYKVPLLQEVEIYSLGAGIIIGAFLLIGGYANKLRTPD